MVWGYTALSVKPTEGPLSTTFARFTFAFVKEGGKGLEAAVPVSQIPRGH
jgi:hypothetical protein